jgi:hypothetical protein
VAAGRPWTLRIALTRLAGPFREAAVPVLMTFEHSQRRRTARDDGMAKVGRGGENRECTVAVAR